jgi:lipid-A-disaccharide synthase
VSSCLVIAGEKSGEEHAMSFFPELKKLCPETHFYGVGGEALEKEGMELLYHLKDFSSMGFSEVIGKIPFYFKALKHLEHEALKRKTQTAILVDFQDFNMRLAQRLSKKGVKVLYYVAPQAWAWKPHRAALLAKSVHTLFSFLPFEKKWFHERGVVQGKSIPHPLMLKYQSELQNIPDRPFESFQKKLKLLLLPGSRKAEVYSLLPEFIDSVRELRKSHNLEVHLVKVEHLNSEIYDYFQKDIDVWYGSEHLVEAMKVCHMCLAASGTVTLSTGLFELPTVVAYKSSMLNVFIFNNFIKYKGFISLTNIVHGKMLFPEFTQERVTSYQLTRVIRSWMKNEKLYNELKAELKNTKSLLSGEDFSVPQYMSQVIHE